MTTGRRAIQSPWLLAAVCCLALDCLAVDRASAAAGTIKNQPGSIKVTYDDALWSASRQGADLNFACKADACGGTAATCYFTEILAEGGITSPNVMKDTLATLDDLLLARFEARQPGSKPEIVESAAERVIYLHPGVFASVRATVDGVVNRYAYFYMDAYHAVLVVICSAPEDRYESGRAAHDDLTGAMRLPRPVQPDPQ